MAWASSRGWLLLGALAGCSSAHGGSDGDAAADARADTAADAPAIDVAHDAPGDGASDVASDAAPADAPSDVASGDAGDGATCVAGALTDAIGACIDAAALGPRACLAQALAALPAGSVPCDADHDGLADDLEAAMAQSYALAFAYNHGDGGHTTGDPEPHWPDNLAHYVSNAHLLWRVDSDTSTEHEVIRLPTLDSIASAVYGPDGGVHSANDPASNQGSDFWLCLQQPGGDYPSYALNGSMDASRTLAGGIDVVSVVHPATGDGTGHYALVTSLLFYPYNEEATVDNHEGDWEGGGVLVDLDAGAVVALYLDRHDSADNVRLLPLVGTGAVRAVDPAVETDVGNVCSDADGAAARGVRFFDYGGARHHAVAFVSTGGHAAYPYPGNTKITGAPGCVESLIVRDTHNGDNAKFLPWLGAFVPGWTTAGAATVTHGVHFLDPGELRATTLPWADFRGQWGCQNGTVAKSWPGPWGNQRHCRAWVTTATWGAAAPFTVPTTGCP